MVFSSSSFGVPQLSARLPSCPLGWGIIFSSSYAGYAARRYGLHVFLEYVAMVVLNFVWAPDPSGDGGDVHLTVPWGDGGVCRLLYDVYQMMSLWSLHRCGPRSCRPQPVGNGGDATPCKVTREERGSLFNLLPQVLLCVANKCQARQGVTTQEAGVSRVTPASNSLTCWRRSEGTDPRTRGHRSKDQSSGVPLGRIRLFFEP